MREDNMGLVVTVKEKGLTEVDLFISGISKNMVDLTVPMKQAAILMMGSIQKNFDTSGRPTPWIPLAASTLKQKIRKGYSSRPLIRSGGLRQSIASQSGKMSMSLGTSIIYGRIHEYGGLAGRNKSAKIPPRPYLLFQRQDLERIRDLIINHLTLGKNNA